MHTADKDNSEANSNEDDPNRCLNREKSSKAVCINKRKPQDVNKDESSSFHKHPLFKKEHRDNERLGRNLVLAREIRREKGEKLKKLWVCI
ncbi:hypothetical protein TNCT_642181 [Trichonephila clavata]|uniref:Uncharacterized protein n=1 Tax=Trichonephila clavata TaxID=2740835 RepID=A0A8X6KCL4_TRICU|nr:hypothetical protein TNCT_642181 [Trichonephila clavata]